VAAVPVAHGCAEASLRELIGHELRWACTIRAVDPWGYVGTVMTHALALALVCAAVLRGSPAALVMVGLAGVCRLWLTRQVDRFAGLEREVWWMLPVRDMLSFGVFLSSLFVRDVEWRGTRFRVDRHGALSQI
jgi:ceramide glucosyltransferase